MEYYQNRLYSSLGPTPCGGAHHYGAPYRHEMALGKFLGFIMQPIKELFCYDWNTCTMVEPMRKRLAPDPFSALETVKVDVEIDITWIYYACTRVPYFL